MSSERSLFDRHYFLLRRLHSLTGVFPIGLFLIFHLTTNASVLWGMLDSRKGAGLQERGVVTFQHEVDFIHSTPFLLMIEIFGLWLPIAFHSILGIYYARTGRSNTTRYAYQSNWRYRWQRITGYVGVLFIFYHVATLRWGWSFLTPGGTKWSAEYAASTLSTILRGSADGSSSFTYWGVIISSFYVIGVIAMVYHFANGLWTAAITWGITVSEQAQRRWGYACFGIGAGLMTAGLGAIAGYAILDPAKARSYEEGMRAQELQMMEPAKPMSTSDRVPTGG